VAAYRPGPGGRLAGPTLSPTPGPPPRLKDVNRLPLGRRITDPRVAAPVTHTFGEVPAAVNRVGEYVRGPGTGRTMSLGMWPIRYPLVSRMGLYCQVASRLSWSAN